MIYRWFSKEYQKRLKKVEILRVDYVIFPHFYVIFGIFKILCFLSVIDENQIVANELYISD